MNIYYAILIGSMNLEPKRVRKLKSNRHVTGLNRIAPDQQALT